MKYQIIVNLTNGRKWSQYAPSIAELQRLAGNLPSIGYVIKDRLTGEEVISHG